MGQIFVKNYAIIMMVDIVVHVVNHKFYQMMATVA